MSSKPTQPTACDAILVSGYSGFLQAVHMCLVPVVIADYQRGHLHLVLPAACLLADGNAHLTLGGPHHLHIVEVYQRLLRTQDCCSDHCLCSERLEAALEDARAHTGVCHIS